MIYPVRSLPLAEQRRILLDSWDRPVACLVADIGTGREKLMADTACWLYRSGRIDRAIFIVPSGTHEHWLEQVMANVPEDIKTDTGSWPYRPTIRDDALALFFVTMEQMHHRSTGKGALMGFMDNFLSSSYQRSLLVVDEALWMADPNDYRAMALHSIAHLAGFRRIIMGAMPPAPSAIWMPFRILSGGHPHLLGMPSIGSFRVRYFKNNRWVDTEQLVARMRAAPTYWLHKEEMADLPGPIRFTRRDMGHGYDGANAPIRELAREIGPKFVVFTHGDGAVERVAPVVEAALWEQGNDIPGMVLRLPPHSDPLQFSPVRAQFWQDPKAHALVTDAHNGFTNLSCAHATVYLEPCGDAACQARCEGSIAWEGRQKPSHFTIEEANK